MRLLWITSEDQKETIGAWCQRDAGLLVDIAQDAAEAVCSLECCTYDAVLASFPVPGWTPEELLEALQHDNPDLPVLIQLASGTLPDAVRLTKLGAYQVLSRQATVEEIAFQIQAATEYRQAQVAGRAKGQGPSMPAWKKILVGESRPMQKITQLIHLVGGRRCTVLITGETGTGKEMVAKAIHLAGPRAQQPLVAVNCTALPENLLEAELFGHVKGAFTGAISHRVGRFEQAHRGTLFLDEIGDMPLDVQAKLLRVLQEREFQRIGSSESVRVDVRVIAASNADLPELIRQGKFREDLYYRLNVIPIHVPPLRERAGDIPLLVHHFVEKICAQENISPKRVTDETLNRLCAHPWPGNVRQLENAVEKAIILSGDRDTLFPSDFALPAPRDLKLKLTPAAPLVRLPDEGLDYQEVVSRFERSILEQALTRTGGNKTQAADILRLKRTTLAAKLKSLEAVACG